MRKYDALVQVRRIDNNRSPVTGRISVEFKFWPDLLLVLLVFYAVHSASFDAIITSFLTGLVFDLISTNPLGAGIIAFGIVGTGLAYLQRVFSLRYFLFASAAIFFAGFACSLIIYFLTLLKTGAAGNLVNAAVWTSLYSAVAGPFLFPALKWLADTEVKHPRSY